MLGEAIKKWGSYRWVGSALASGWMAKGKATARTEEVTARAEMEMVQGLWTI